MVISKSLQKREWSTKKLASKLTIKGPQCSEDTFHRYSRSNLGAYPCKRPALRKISKNQMAKDFIFSRRDRSGQFEDLMRIIFTDACLVYLSVPGTRKNDHIWAKNRSKVEAIQKSKFAPKIIVWVAMPASGVSKLHVLHPNQTVRAKYYQESILSLFLPDDINITSYTGKVTERRFYENMLDLTLLQNTAPAHKATESQDWL
jgi:hypothetical protein